MFTIRNLFLAGLALASTVSAAGSDVKALTPDTFDDIVLKSGKPSLVEFYAPWCGHCKNLAPVYEELATAFSWASDKVSVAKVDADEHKSLGTRFGIKGFPTIKWFDGTSDKPIDYSGGRDLESLSKWISDKTGVKSRAKKATPSEVVMLTDRSFKETVGSKDKDVLVAFTAPWCGHCKTLAPIYELVAQDFSSESSVVIAKVDAEAENSKQTAKDQGVSSYPTIKFFPKGSKEGKPYEGARSQEAFVNFLNENTGTARAVGGGLNPTAGTIAALDAILAKVGTDSVGAVGGIYNELFTSASSLKDKYAEYYGKVAKKMTGSNEYASKELKRLEGILKKGGLAREKQDDLVSRSNVLRKFMVDVKESASSAASVASESISSGASAASSGASSGVSAASKSASSGASVVSESVVSGASAASKSASSGASVVGEKVEEATASVKGEL